MARFEEMLIELGDELDTTLHADEMRVCRIEINETIEVQLEMDSTDTFLIIACQVIELPPGKFREKAVLDILRANDYLNKQVGIFSYLPKINMLVMHDKILLASINSPTDFVEYLKRFSERAYLWRQSIKGGKTHPDDSLAEPTDDSPHSIEMGLKT
ncbi:MAG: CesT family type III secretion system chaperone [Rhabdochlamydiaceae bacterium]|nr:CesT family type III secretion system chaperone [Candidatus Amphrikana amoebophyrae]